MGPSWGYVVPSWGLCCPGLRLCGPILELCWPILGLCWPILGLCWPILRPMLAHLEAYLRLRKMRKNAKSTKHRKTRGFLALPGGSAAGGRGPSLLRRGENCRTARTRPGGPWPDLRAGAPRRLRRISRPSISSQCGLESFWMGTCFRNILLLFFEKSSWNRNFVGNRRLFWGASGFPKAPAKSLSRTTAANFNWLLRVKAPLCKDFSV